MSLWKEMEKDGELILKEFGRVVRFRGQQYIVLVQTNLINEAMVQGGFHKESSYSLRWLLKEGSDLSIRPPEYGEQVEVYGEQMTIVSTTYRPPSPWMDTTVQPTD